MRFKPQMLRNAHRESTRNLETKLISKCARQNFSKVLQQRNRKQEVVHKEMLTSLNLKNSDTKCKEYV